MVLFIGVAAAVLCLYLPRGAQASCPEPECCYGNNFGEDVDLVVTMAEVKSIAPPSVTLEYLEAPVYCDDGAECSVDGLPEEVGCGLERCPWPMGCDHLEVGQRWMVAVDRADGCLWTMFLGLEGGVWCGWSRCFPIDEQFALSHFFSPMDACQQTYYDMGAWTDCPYPPVEPEDDCDGEDGHSGCTSAGGHGVINLDLLLLVMVVLVSARARVTCRTSCISARRGKGRGSLWSPDHRNHQRGGAQWRRPHGFVGDDGASSADWAIATSIISTRSLSPYCFAWSRAVDDDYRRHVRPQSDGP